MSVCPCRITPPSAGAQDSSKSYQDCCQPYHESFAAPDAERLMRSRYSAFVLQMPEYIIKTTVPAQQALLDVDAIEQWGKETDWAGLEIVQHQAKLGKRHAQVEFKAYFRTDNGVQAHHERSGFVKIVDKDKQARWYFIDPTVRMNVSQKQPCICGSGEKFKRCCGGYVG